jgi:transcriptional regulator with GAF, ATPase, and Fis domain
LRYFGSDSPLTRTPFAFQSLTSAIEGENMQAWYRVFSGVSSESTQAIRAALHLVEVEMCELDRHVSGPGLVIFDHDDQEIRTFLKEASQTVNAPIIAIGLSREGIAEADVWHLLGAGAWDVLCWENAEQGAQTIAARLSREEQIDELVHSPLVQKNVVGHSAVGLAMLRQLVELARFTDSTVLLIGESGTGKELAARLIHTLDTRENNGDLVVLDCTTIVPELSGSEFFGHERGAFTGAITARDGAFGLANKGTLFLDEVAELPLGLQGQLLRVVQERVYKRVGGNTWHRTNFRLICATNRDLAQEVVRGRFRADLYYRIAGRIVPMPTLRDRLDDVIPLITHFIRELRPTHEPSELDDIVKDYLLCREYPGNVRDLRQLVARMLSHHVGPGPITVGDLPREERPSGRQDYDDWCNSTFEQCIRRAIAQGVGLKEIGRIAENMAVRIAVSDEQGSLQRAATKLKVTDRALQIRRAMNTCECADKECTSKNLQSSSPFHN